jgi:hypothetical protein
MSDIPETIFDQIAKLLPPDLREHFFRRIAHLLDLSPNDDMLLIAEAMGFLALLIRETPPLITAERLSLENSIREALGNIEALHRNTLQSNTQLEDRLLDLPAEIQAGIDADVIATKIAETIHQTFVQTHLAGISDELRIHTAAINDASQQIGSLAATLGDAQRGAPARVQQATASMVANITSAANHIRTLSRDLSSQIRHSIALLCTAALALGFLLGWFFHQ